MNDLHTKGRIKFRENGDANSYALLTEDGNWWLSLLMNGEIPSLRQKANLQRIATCWSAHDALLEALEALTTWGRDHTSPRDANSPHDLLIAAVAAIANARA